MLRAQRHKYFTLAMVILLLTLTNAYAVLIDRIAATIDSEVITYSDMQMEKAFKLSERATDDEEVLKELIDRRLLLMEARKFKITETEEEGQKTLLRFHEFKRELGEGELHKILNKFNLAEPDIINRLKDKHLAEKFISFRINFFVIIPDNTIKTYYSEHKSDFANRALADVYEEIKTRLFQDESRHRLQDYMIQLRRKAKITVNQPVKG